LLAEKHQAEIDRILSKYPPDQKRAAVLPMLYLAQHTYGHITEEAIDEIAAILDLDPTQVGGLTGFYTLLQLCENLSIKLGETTEDGLVTVEEVMCLAGCDKAPMFQLQDDEGIHYHENQDVASAMKLIDELRKRSGDD
jgi:NADH-quinone oxidoreductase subunit E